MSSWRHLKRFFKLRKHELEGQEERPKENKKKPKICFQLNTDIVQSGVQTQRITQRILKKNLHRRRRRRCNN